MELYLARRGRRRREMLFNAEYFKALDAQKAALKAYLGRKTCITPSGLQTVLRTGLLMRFCAECAKGVSEVPGIFFQDAGLDSYKRATRCILCGEPIDGRLRRLYNASMSHNGQALFFAVWHSVHFKDPEVDPEELAVVAAELNRLVSGKQS